MSIPAIPEKIADFNVYKKGTKLIGVTAEVSLPELTQNSETISGPGILGEIDAPSIGQFGSLEQTIPFRVLYDDAFSLANPTEGIDLTLRGSIQLLDGEGNIKFIGMRVVMRGTQKGINLGSVSAGAAMGSEVTLELTYLLVEIDKQNRLELDKINSVYKINGVDVLAKSKELC